jgi:flagellar motility protein MotE (MotC chaperone)
MIQMDFTAQSVKGVIDTLRVQVGALESEIKADLESKAEFERHLKVLETRKQDLLARIKSNKTSIQDFDSTNIAENYKNMTEGIATIYANAKKGHASGIVLLQKEFGYHPVFKRPGDTFTATAFRPM